MLYEGCTSSSQSFISCLQKKYKVQEPVWAQIDGTARGRHAIHYALVGAFPNAAQKIHYASSISISSISKTYSFIAKIFYERNIKPRSQSKPKYLAQLQGGMQQNVAQKTRSCKVKKKTSIKTGAKWPTFNLSYFGLIISKFSFKAHSCHRKKRLTQTLGK